MEAEADPNSCEIGDLIRSFSASVISLSEDAETTLGLAAVVSAATANDASASSANGRPSSETTSSVLDQLQSLEETVSHLEGQMSMLQEAVREEQVAIQELEHTKALADEQSAIIEKMMQATQEMGIGVGTGTAVGAYAVASSATVITASTGTSIETAVSTDNYSNASKGGVGNSVEAQRAKKQQQQQQLHLDLVTESELNSVCKNIRGRIPLAWVNDALVDILSVARRKYAVMMKYDKTGLSKLTMGNDYKRRMSLSRKHQSYLNRHYDIEVKELEGTYWVSEQDLRDSCGFFAKESSARAILLILRNLKRLKQVYGRRSMVTYILLTPKSTNK